MIRPEQMSYISIYLNREFIPNFLEDIIEVKNFHVNSEFSIDTPKDKLESLKNKQFKSIISEKKAKKVNDQIYEIRRYIDEIIEKTNIEPENAKPGRSLVELKFGKSTDFIVSILEEVEDLYYKVKRISKKISQTDHTLEKIAEMASLMRMIHQFGGDDYEQDVFKKLEFELYVTEAKHYEEFKEAAEGLKSPIVNYGEELCPGLIGFFVFYEKEYQKHISDLLLTYNCQKIDIPERYINEQGFHMDLLQEDHDKNVIKRNKYAEIYKEIEKNLPEQIMGYYEALENAIEIVNILIGFQQTTSQNIVKIEGFVPSKIEKDFIEALKEQFKSNIKITSKIVKRSDPYEEESHDENEEKKIKAPTKIKLNKLAEPFGILTNLYGTTGYSEIDPSFLMIITFPIIFGLMFGDIGHGLVLLVTGLVGSQVTKKKNESMSKFILLLGFLGIGAIIGGLMYGEFFGSHIIINGEPFRLFVNPIEEITTLIKMSIIVGVATIIIGWILRFINLVMNHRIFYAFADPFVKILMMIGGTYLILTYYFDIYAWIEPPTPILLVVIPSIIFIIIRPLGKIFHVASYLKKKKASGLFSESIFEYVETMLQIISNVASFMRILALEMAHIGLMIVMNEVGGSLIPDNFAGTYIIYPLVFVFYNLFVIVLETVLVMIHCLRLHFYEFFSKFYIADGIPFKPVEIKNEYSFLTFAQQKNLDLCFNFHCEEN